MLDRGRASARARTEQNWHAYRTDHLPDLTHWPDTGYRAAA